MKEVYLCSEYLEAHPLFKLFGSDLASLAQKDYPGKGYFEGKSISSIDLDEFERNTKRSNDCTSDGVVGISDVLDSRITNRRLLLTELRMDYVNPKNLDFSNIRKKYIHSSEILREYGADKRINSEFALIFSKNTAPKARRWISSWAKESSKKDAADWRSYDPESFCNYINYGKKLPLRPTSETVVKVAEWCGKDEMSFEELNLLKEKILAYWWVIKGKNRFVDLEYISGKLQLFLSEVSFASEEERELCMLLRDEIEEIISSI
ncbi:MAG: hypothetical protein K2M83_01355 [Muribaculaceae bacterium]|nr:hypothetical protein [Muribaculaceae bacterium]